MAQKQTTTKDPNLGFEIVEESLDDIVADEPQQAKEQQVSQTKNEAKKVMTQKNEDQKQKQPD